MHGCRELLNINMQSKIINLRHSENLIIKKPHFRRKPKHLLREINRSEIHCILGFLRLADICTFYRSLQCCSKLDDAKDLLLHYLITSKRQFSKWEEQEFLDCILLGFKVSDPPEAQRQQEVSAVSASSQTIQLNNQQLPEYFKNPETSSAGNENSMLRLFREQIHNDVKRTHVLATKKQTYNRKQMFLATHESTDPYADSSNISRQSELTIQSQADAVQGYMNRVLLTISKKHSELGYIQGFNYIVRNMYLTGFTEAQAVQYMLYLLEGKQLSRMISRKMGGIRRLSYVLKVYLFNYTPRIYQHFQVHGVDAEIFSTCWFVTLFSEDLPPPIVNKLWRLFVLEDWKIFIQFVIALLCVFQQPILDKDRDEIFPYMRRILAIFSVQALTHSDLEINVWKLMASVRVSDLLIKSLADQMEVLQHDCEIELWKLQINLHHRASSRTQPNFMTFSSNENDMRVSQPVYTSTTCCVTPTCCERVAPSRYYHSLATRANSSSQKGVCLFNFCHNVDRDP